MTYLDPTNPDQAPPVDPLQLARQQLSRYHDKAAQLAELEESGSLTSGVVRRLQGDAGGAISVASAAALVSIAESLAVLAEQHGPRRDIMAAGPMVNLSPPAPAVRVVPVPVDPATGQRA